MGEFQPIGVARCPEVDALIQQGAAVAIGISGGKDSQAAALATVAYLDSIGHTGPRLLIHADLGTVEWDESFPVCERMADAKREAIRGACLDEKPGAA